MTAILNLGFDIAIFIALSVVIYYCIRLSRQFVEIREDRAAFENLFKAMNLASARAEGAIKSLKDAINEDARALQEKINKGKGLSEELEIIIQAGDGLANRLEEISSKSSKAVHSKKHNNEDEEKGNFKTQAEKNLIEAIKASRT